MSRDSNRSRRGGSGGRRGGRGRSLSFDDEPESPRRRDGSRRGGGRKRKRGGLDFSDDDEDSQFDGRAGRGRDRDRYDDEDDDERPGRRGRSRRKSEDRPTLMDLCTPVFGYAAVLPRQPGDAQPDYRQFRDQVVDAIKRIESRAAESGIEAEDANQAAYALSFFMDSQVAGSGWEGKTAWSTEPLGIVLQRDPEGGVNFFNRLRAFGDRQKEVKEVYLVCLALGFRGKLAELDAAEQARVLAEEKKRLADSIRSASLDQKSELFPEAYEPAQSIEDEIPPPPRWWMFASLGVVLGAVLLWLLLFLWAGRSPRAAAEVVHEQIGRIPERPEAVAVVEPGDEDEAGNDAEPAAGEDGP